MRECDDLLNDHGGHAMAAGVSVKPGQVDAFRERINKVAKKTINSEMFLSMMVQRQSSSPIMSIGQALRGS